MYVLCAQRTQAKEEFFNSDGLEEVTISNPRRVDCFSLSIYISSSSSVLLSDRLCNAAAPAGIVLPWKPCPFKVLERPSPGSSTSFFT